MSADKIELEPMLALKSGRYYYLCTYRNEWDPQKGRSYRKSTTSVGKILSGRKDGPVEWKDIYLEQHPELADYACSRGEDGTLSFEPVNGAGTGPSHHLGIGATWTLSSIVQGTPLEDALRATFSKYSDWRKLLSLAFFMVISNENVMSRYSYFSKHNYLPWTRVMAPDDVHRLLSRITPEKLALFRERLLKLQDPSSPRYLLFCSSSIYKRHTSFSWSARADISDDESRSPENCMMAVDEQSGLPLCYRLSRGRRVPDVAALKALMTALAHRDLGDKVLYVADRGYASAGQVSGYLREGMHFLVNPRVHHGIFRSLMEASRRRLFELANFHPAIGCAAITRRVHWSYYINRDGQRRRQSASLYLHVYFDESVYNLNREGIKRGIGLVLETLSRGETLPEDLEEVRDLYMQDAAKGGALEVNEDAVKLTLDRRSVRLLLSDSIADPVEAFRDYFDRNEVWAGFKTYRERLGGSRLVSGDDADLEGKAFVQFLACSLAVMLRRRLAKAGSAVAGLPYNSDDVILGMLSGIEMNCSPRLGAVVGEPSRKLGELLDAIGITLPRKDLPKPQQEVEAAAVAEERDYAESQTQGKTKRLSREELIFRQLS